MRELHLGGERREMRGGEMTVAILDEMQMLDQQIAPARLVAEQRAHLVEGRRIDLAALRRAARAVLFPARAAVVDWGARVHPKSLVYLRQILNWLVKNNPVTAIV